MKEKEKVQMFVMHLCQVDANIKVRYTPDSYTTYRTLKELTDGFNVSDCSYLKKAMLEIRQRIKCQNWLYSQYLKKGFDTSLIKMAYPSIGGYEEKYFNEAITMLDEVINRGDGQNSKPIDNDIFLPMELDTDEARKIFPRALERGYMEQTATGFRWLFGGNRGQVRLGYFLYKIYQQPRPINALEKVFGISKLSASITQASYAATRTDVKQWRTEMDKNIFYN